MQSIYPEALWRPLSNIQSEPNIGVPRLLIWHTMVGSLKGTENLFKRGGYDGVESTFGLGHTTDGASLDGVLWQWQSLTRQADANSSGNAYATSIECSDGGQWQDPFSTKQIEASIALGVWWCKQTGIRPVKAKAWNGSGFGYHNMFREWNPDAHACPGPVRAKQLETIIWPKIARILEGQEQTNPTPVPAQGWPKFPLGQGAYYGEGGIFHADSLKAWQRQMVARGWDINVNGYADTNCVAVAKAFQKEKGLGQDGRIGLNTWNAAWVAPIT